MEIAHIVAVADHYDSMLVPKSGWVFEEAERSAVFHEESP